MLRSTSVVITTTGASPLMELSPVSRPTSAGPWRQPHGELPHHRLAGAGRGRHQRAAAAGERQAASALEVVELEGVAAGELLHQRPRVAGLARPPGGKLFHGAHAARRRRGALAGSYSAWGAAGKPGAPSAASTAIAPRWTSKVAGRAPAGSPSAYTARVRSAASSTRLARWTATAGCSRCRPENTLGKVSRKSSLPIAPITTTSSRPSSRPACGATR